MLSKYLSSTLLLFALSIHVDAHAAIFPALGVLGTPVRGDVQVPSKPSPCGNINVAANINNSTAVQADPNGQFKVNVIDFNPGKDGSRHVSLTVDPTGLGIGTSFVNGTVSKNGNPDPTTVDTEQITASLPDGIICHGGATKNLCLAAFVTDAGFGGCVVVRSPPTSVTSHTTSTTSKLSGTKTASSKASHSTGATNTTTSHATTTATSTASHATTTATSTASHHHHHHHHHNHHSGTSSTAAESRTAASSTASDSMTAVSSTASDTATAVSSTTSNTATAVSSIVSDTAGAVSSTASHNTTTATSTASHHHHPKPTDRAVSCKNLNAAGTRAARAMLQQDCQI